MRLKLLLLTLAISTFSFAQEKLSNQSIIDLVELGFESETIKSKIENSITEFDTSIKALKLLKEKNVPTEILTLMMNRSRVVIETGIFIYEGDILKKLEPTVFSGSSSSNLLSAVTYGIGAAKNKSYLPNMNATNILDINDQVFIFQFAEKEFVDSNNWWFGEASSPNQFVLVKLNAKKRKNRREMVTSKSSAGNSESGVPSESTVQLTIEKVGNNNFKVKPSSKLEKGEYCFFYQGLTPTGYSNQSVFDFSIR